MKISLEAWTVVIEGLKFSYFSFSFLSIVSLCFPIIIFFKKDLLRGNNLLFLENILPSWNIRGQNDPNIRRKGKTGQHVDDLEPKI